MPPLDPMQKKSRVSVKTVGLGYFSTDKGFVLVTAPEKKLFFGLRGSRGQLGKGEEKNAAKSIKACTNGPQVAKTNS